jgi:hypothetical protein
MDEKFQLMHKHIYNFIREILKYPYILIFYSFKKKNMPYAYPLDWTKIWSTLVKTTLIYV